MRGGLLIQLVLLSLAASISADECPGVPEERGCECLYDAITGYNTMTCKTNYLTSIPEIPADIHELVMERHQIETLLNNSFINPSTSTNKLKKIVLRLCKIREIEVNAFDSLYDLEELEMDINDIQTLPGYAFRHLNRLRTLVLSQNLLNETSPEAFEGLANLEALDLSNNRLTAINDNTFINLPSLKTLRLNNNVLTSLPENIFTANQLLEDLQIGKNRITEIYPNTFNSTPVINYINLESNKLTTLDGTVFDSLPELKMLNLLNNKFICDCMMADFKRWAMTADLEWMAKQTGVCESPEELKGQFIWNVAEENFICTTTTTTTTITTTTTSPKPTTSTTDNVDKGSTEAVVGLDETTRNIIIGCTVGGAIVLALIILIACCCVKYRKNTRPRQVKYILKPGGPFDHLPRQGDKPIQNGTAKNRDEDPESRPVMEGSTSTIDNEFEGSYRPNIVPLETDLDDDIQHGQSAVYDGRYFSPAYNNSLNRMNKGSPVSFTHPDSGLAFYNSLNRSIMDRSSIQPTPIGSLQRATPLSRSYQATPNLSYHRATPVVAQETPHMQRTPYTTPGYEPPTPWRDNMAYKDDRAYPTYPETGGAYPAIGGAYPGDGYPTYDDYNGKYSTGSAADSGVHSNSPAPRERTPTDFSSDHQMSPNHHALDQSKIVKNETYV